MKTLIRLLFEEQSDLGLHCLPRPICPKTSDHYGTAMCESAVVHNEPRHEKTCFQGFLIRQDTNQAVQSQKMAIYI